MQSRVRHRVWTELLESATGFVAGEAGRERNILKRSSPPEPRDPELDSDDLIGKPSLFVIRVRRFLGVQLPNRDRTRVIVDRREPKNIVFER